eukprot:2868624-Rhodomonas_salina.2
MRGPRAEVRSKAELRRKIAELAYLAAVRVRACSTRVGSSLSQRTVALVGPYATSVPDTVYHTLRRDRIRHSIRRVSHTGWAYAPLVPETGWHTLH